MDPHQQNEPIYKKESTIQFITDFPDVVTIETLLQHAPPENQSHGFQVLQSQPPNQKQQKNQNLELKIDPSKLAVKPSQENNNNQPPNEAKKSESADNKKEHPSPNPPKKNDKEKKKKDHKKPSPNEPKKPNTEEQKLPKPEDKKPPKHEDKKPPKQEDKKTPTKEDKNKKKSKKNKHTQDDKTKQPQDDKINDNSTQDSQPANESENPFVYSFNHYEWSIFNRNTQQLNKIHQTTYESFAERFMPDIQVTSYILLDEITCVYSTPEKLVIHSQQYGAKEISMPGISELRPDFTIDMLHFYVLANKSLYIFQYHEGDFRYNQLHNDVDSFDFSRQYLTISKKKMVKVYRRIDFLSKPIMKMPIENQNRIYCDDNYLYLFDPSSHRVTSYIISPNQSPIRLQIMEKIQKVFSSDEIIFLQDDIFRIKDSIYHLDNHADYIILYDNLLAFFDNSGETARVKSFQSSNKSLDFDSVKEDVKEAISKIESLNSIYESYMKKLNELILNSIPVINNSFDSSKKRLQEVSIKIKEIESQAMKAGGSPEMCIQLFDKNPDLAFRAAANYSIKNLLCLCKHKNCLVEALNSNLISDETKLEIAEIFTDNITNISTEIVPLFIPLLLSFDPDNEIVKARVKPLVNTILSATMRLFPSVAPSTPIYMSLRRLTHIAMSFKVI